MKLMKRTLTTLISLLTAFAMVIPASASDSGNELGTVPGTSETLTLDGTKESAYKNALHINKMYSQDEKTAPLAKTDFYLVYDKDALWIFCEVEDATLTTKASDPNQPSYKVDSIEVMLDMTNKGENIPDQTPLQCRIDHNNQISGRLGQKGTSLFLRKSEGGTIEFFDAVAVKTDKGFNAEFRIPFTEAPEVGSKLGLNLCYNDWDKDDGNRIILGSTQGVSSWESEKYDFVILGEIAKVKSSGTTAAQTADPIIAASISMILAAAVLVCKKRRAA